MWRNPINCLIQDDEEDGDIQLCSTEVSNQQEDSQGSELRAKIQMTEIMEQAEENFTLNNPMDTYHPILLKS